jgi:hypothetical protein
VDEKDLYFVVLGLEGEPLYAENIDEKPPLKRQGRRANVSYFDFVPADSRDEAIEAASAKAITEMFGDE